MGQKLIKYVIIVRQICIHKLFSNKTPSLYSPVGYIVKKKKKDSYQDLLEVKVILGKAVPKITLRTAVYLQLMKMCSI